MNHYKIFIKEQTRQIKIFIDNNKGKGISENQLALLWIDFFSKTMREKWEKQYVKL